MIPHKSKKYDKVLDLPFSQWLENGFWTPSIHEASMNSVPTGTIDQIGHSLFGSFMPCHPKKIGYEDEDIVLMAG